MVAYGGVFFEGQRLRLFGVNGRRGWGAKSCMRLACLCDECVTSLPCPVSPGLWRRAEEGKPLRDVCAANISKGFSFFGGRLSGPPVQRDGHRASSIWRNDAPPS